MSGDSTPPDDTELDGCELGTIEYWENSYVKENANYRSHGNVGEVWFDEDSQFRVIKWMETRDLKNKSIVDLGELAFGSVSILFLCNANIPKAAATE